MSWLGSRDSNPDTMVQSHVSCRFTGFQPCRGSILLDGGPDAALQMNEETRGLVGKWLSKRYHRAVFPDSFNDRLRPELGAIRDALRKNGEHLQDIYLTLDTDDEWPVGRPYKVIALGTVRAEAWDVPAHRTAAQACFDKEFTHLRSLRQPHSDYVHYVSRCP